VAEPRKILIVDDNADIRSFLKLALETAGYSVQAATNGEEALALQRKDPADILITDIFMPERDGFELIDAMRSEFPHVKVVVISGGPKSPTRKYLSDAALMGVEVTLQKPFDIETLVRTLESL
jgi:CheY-like chemotaxis protein